MDGRTRRRRARLARTGGPSTLEPQALGFGLTIVRSSIEAQFRGGVVYDWRPEGLHCALRCRAPRSQPLSRPATSPQPAAPAAGRRTRRSLADKRLLVVEDELLVSMLVKSMLDDLGADVIGPCGRLAEGVAAAKAERFDGAILDLNLAGEAADPLADLLLARGVPFVFITGYQRDSLDRRFANVPVLQKPIDAAVARTRAAVAARRPAGAARRRLYGLIDTQAGSIAALAISTKRSSGQALSRA